MLGHRHVQSAQARLSHRKYRRESSPERAQTIQISGGASRAWMEDQSYDALIQKTGQCTVILDLCW